MEKILKIKVSADKGLEFEELKIFQQGDFNTNFLQLDFSDEINLEDLSAQINYYKADKVVVYDVITPLEKSNKIKIPSNALSSIGEVYIGITLKKGQDEIITLDGLVRYIVCQTIAGIVVEQIIPSENLKSSIYELIEVIEKLLKNSKVELQNKADEEIERIKENSNSQIELIETSGNTQIAAVKSQSTKEKEAITSHAAAEKNKVTVEGEKQKNIVETSMQGFDENVAEKTNTFNSNVSEKIKEVNEAGEEQLGKIEATGIENKQDKVDNNLQTISKNIVGAINENSEKVSVNTGSPILTDISVSGTKNRDSIYTYNGKIYECLNTNEDTTPTVANYELISNEKLSNIRLGNYILSVEEE